MDEYKVTAVPGSIIPPHKYEDLYKRLNESLSIFASKIGSEIIKFIITNVAKYSIGLLGLKYTKEFIFPGSNFEHNKLRAVVSFRFISTTDLSADVAAIALEDIDANIDQISYDFVMAYIRAATTIKTSDVYKDSDLIDLVSKYYSILFMKTNKDVIIPQSSIELYDSVIKYFIDRFILNKKHNIAIDNIKDKSLKNKLNYFSSYTKFQDIFKALSSSDVALFPSATTMSYNVLKKLGYTFQYIISSPDIYHILAIIVGSRYPHEYVKNALVDDILQKKIEARVLEYVKKIDIDPLF